MIWDEPKLGGPGPPFSNVWGAWPPCPPPLHSYSTAFSGYKAVVSCICIRPLYIINFEVSHHARKIGKEEKAITIIHLGHKVVPIMVNLCLNCTTRDLSKKTSLVG